MFSQHLPRWIFACVTNHFAASTQDYPAYVEGEIKDEMFQDYFEIRLNGPMLTQISNKVWSVEVGVSIFTSSLINDTTTHRIHEMVGIIASAYTDIGISRVGPVDPVNDGTPIGCLKAGEIKINHFGQLDADKPLMRATVDGTYTGLITES